MLLLSHNRFPKTHRLLTRGEFVEVQNGGQKISSRFFVGLFSPGDVDTPARLGITASRRYGNAVARNRAKRIVREAFRTHLLCIPTGLRIVVLPRHGLHRATTQEAFADMEVLSRRIHRALEKASP